MSKPLSATELDDEEILALRPTDRAKVLAELARLGTILVPCLVDVSAPCPNERCQGGHVDLLDGNRIPCHRCDGTGAVDGRPVCLDPECLDYRKPLSPTLAGPWECPRRHGHGHPKPPFDVELPEYRPQASKASGALMSGAEVEAELRGTGWINHEPYGWRHPIAGTYHDRSDAHALSREVRARHEAARKRFERDSDPFPWDAPETYDTITLGGVTLSPAAVQTMKAAVDTVITATASPVTAPDLPALVSQRTEAPNPFDGWTIQPWEGNVLHARDADDNDEIVGFLDGGWFAWLPLDEDTFAEGHETGQAGRDAVAAALRGRGAKL